MLEYLVSAIVVICAKNLILGVMLVQSGNKMMQHVASWHLYLVRITFTVSAANSKQCSQGDIHWHRAILSKGMILYKQVIKEWTRKGALLDLILWTRKSWLETSCQVRGSLGCSDHEIMELKALRGGNRAKSKTTAPDFRRAKCSLFRDLLGRILWNTAPERRGVQERWVLRKGQSQRVGNQAKMAGGLYGWARSAKRNPDIQRKCMTL